MKHFRFVHASGDTFMPLSEERSDIHHLLSLDPLWMTLTEGGERATVKAIQAVVRREKAPYYVINPDAGDIIFLVNKEARIAGYGGPLSIPAKSGPAKEGGHGPRHNSWAELHWGNEVIFANGVHFVTFHTNHASNSGDRSVQQVKQANDVGKQMERQAQGTHIAVGSGDLNGSLPQRKDLQRIFNAHHMTTTAHETGVMTGTHGQNRIDYAWTMDRDRRLHVVHMRVLKSSIIKSDHDPIVNDCVID
jgi:hypothetical protein